MELIAQIPLIGGTLAVLLPFIVVLGIVVSVHEFGHYIVGRWCGIHAEVFSLGFGKTLWSRVDRHGTKWQVALLPLGGYVKFLGDADASSRHDAEAVAKMDPAMLARSFPGASTGRRFLTVLAGPVFNFILSTLVFAGLIMWQGEAAKPVIGEVAAVPGEPLPFQPGDIVTSINGAPVTMFADILDLTQQAQAGEPMQVTVERGGKTVELVSPFLRPPLVGDMLPLSPAIDAGLQRGDYLVSANGVKLQTFYDLQAMMNEYKAGPVRLEVWRAGEMLDISLVPAKTVVEDAEGNFVEKVVIGVDSGFAIQPQTEFVAPWTALYYGAERVVLVIESSFKGIAHIVTGKISAANLQGPLGIAQVSGEMATKGLVDFIFLIGYVSTAIGMLNLFPVPVLDGGHLVVFSYEALRGRPASAKVLEMAMSVGLAMLLLLMLFATYNDIMRL